jgi:hypothetical protein
MLARETTSDTKLEDTFSTGNVRRMLKEKRVTSGNATRTGGRCGGKLRFSNYLTARKKLCVSEEVQMCSALLANRSHSIKEKLNGLHPNEVLIIIKVALCGIGFDWLQVIRKTYPATHSFCRDFYRRIFQKSVVGGLGVACWPLVPKFTGSNQAEAVGFLRAKKSLGGEVKPLVPCRRFAACKRSPMA